MVKENRTKYCFITLALFLHSDLAALNLISEVRCDQPRTWFEVLIQIILTNFVVAFIMMV